MRILVADDDNMARHLLNRTLSRWGHDVASVSDGAEAWEILRKDSAPPVAILDWMMPEMTGIEVCRKVRQLPSPVTYLIVLTSKDEKEDGGSVTNCQRPAKMCQLGRAPFFDASEGRITCRNCVTRKLSTRMRQ